MWRSTWSEPAADWCLSQTQVTTTEVGDSGNVLDGETVIWGEGKGKGFGGKVSREVSEGKCRVTGRGMESG